MSRVVPAARQLARQVKEQWPEAAVTVVDDPDGLGFQRTLLVTKAKELAKALQVLRDPRIAEVTKTSKGLRIRFVADTRADHADPYPLPEVVAILTG